jgi:hypothetical protein
MKISKSRGQAVPHPSIQLIYGGPLSRIPLFLCVRIALGVCTGHTDIRVTCGADSTCKPGNLVRAKLPEESVVIDPTMSEMMKSMPFARRYKCMHIVDKVYEVHNLHSIC